jgi:hypothetical protein
MTNGKAIVPPIMHGSWEARALCGDGRPGRPGAKRRLLFYGGIETRAPLPQKHAGRILHANTRFPPRPAPHVIGCEQMILHD